MDKNGLLAHPLLDAQAVKILIPHITAKLLWRQFLRDVARRKSVDVYLAQGSTHFPYDSLKYTTSTPLQNANLTIHNIYCDAEHQRLYYVRV